METLNAQQQKKTASVRVALAHRGHRTRASPCVIITGPQRPILWGVLVSEGPSLARSIVMMNGGWWMVEMVGKVVAMFTVLLRCQSTGQPFIEGGCQ